MGELTEKSGSPDGMLKMRIRTEGGEMPVSGEMKSTDAINTFQTTIMGQIHLQMTADVNITASIAKRMVNVELMKKVGDLIMTGEPELLVDGQKVYWKVPFLVVPPDDDSNTYPTGEYALVEAFSGLYVLKEGALQKLRAAAGPILDCLYPDLEAYIQKIREVQSR